MSEGHKFLRAIADAQDAGDTVAADAARAAYHAYQAAEARCGTPAPAPSSGTRERKKRAPKPPRDPALNAGKSKVVVDTDESRVIDDTEGALSQHPRLFVNPVLVELDADDVPRALSKHRVRDIATECAFFVKEKASDSDMDAKEVDVHPPEWLGAAILARPSLKLRALEGVVRMPILRADGSTFETPGYDAESRLFYAPTVAFPSLPSKPHAGDAAAAYERLADLFIDFPYENPELGAAVAVATILTFVARHLLDHAPAKFASGSGPGCGKGLEADVITLVGLGLCLARSPWPADGDEQRKILDGFARRSARGILLDNVVAPVGGADIERFVTSTSFDVRLLGRTETTSFPQRSTVLVTGNNVRFGGDMPRRSFLSRIVPEDDRPDARTDWKHPRLRESVETNRASFTVDALTILAAHARAGRPKACRDGAWGSFEQWTNVVADAVGFAGGVDPIEARVVRDTRTDTVGDALEGLVRLWLAFGGPVDAEVACAHFLAKIATDEESRVFLDEILDEHAPAKSDKQTRAARLSTVLARHADRWVTIADPKNAPRLLGFVKGKSGMYGRLWKLSSPGRP